MRREGVMKPSIRSIVCTLGAVLVLGPAPATVAAQNHLTVSVGPSQYDLSGTGWSGIAGVHVDAFVRSWLGVEAGSGVFFYETQGGTDVTMLLPEVGLRFVTPTRVPVHLALGAGYTLGIQGDQREEPVLYGALGLSIDLGNGWQLRPEMRLRVVDPWVGGIGGYTVGASKRLGG
jgi:hypothetical protein